MMPDSTFSDAPCFDASTISLTWRDFIDVNQFTISGMMAPASVPQEMMAARRHHKLPSPRSPMSQYDEPNTAAIETAQVMRMSRVRPASKSIFSAFFEPESMTKLMPYDTSDVRIMIDETVKSHTMSGPCSVFVTASMMNVMSATAVTP